MIFHCQWFCYQNMTLCQQSPIGSQLLRGEENSGSSLAALKDPPGLSFPTYNIGWLSACPSTWIPEAAQNFKGTVSL